MDNRAIKNRIGAVRRLMSRNKADCLIVTKPPNVSYTTGFLGQDSWALITAAKVYLLTDSRYLEQAQTECAHCTIIQRTRPLAEAAARLVNRLKSVRTAGIETSTSLADFRKLNKSIGPRLKPAADIIEQVRLIKDNTEIEAVKTAARIAHAALRQIHSCVKPGITENELAGALDFEIRRLGASACFETIVAFGANASRPHHRPGGRKLAKSDTILVDFGARYANYCCDLTRCFVVGRPTAFYRKTSNAVREAQEAAIKMVRAGAEIRQVDAAARDVIQKYELPVYGHGTGHGLGLEVHEQPVISKDAKGKLKAGMVFTIEPAVYVPGKLGVRIEDDVLVTESGCEILSRDSGDNAQRLEIAL